MPLYFRIPHLPLVLLFLAYIVLFALAATTLELGATGQDQAHFVVRDEVVNSNMQPFTASIGSIGNGHRLSLDSGFEPLVFRTMIQTTADSLDRVVASPSAISNWDTWRTGALDGAEVEILRIENGAFRSVRRDRVIDGGYQANGWSIVIPDNRVVAPSLTSYEFTWDSHNRPSVKYYFSVRALDRQGRLSRLGMYVDVMAPNTLPRQRPEVANQLIDAEVTGREGQLSAPENLEVILTEEGIVRLNWSPVEGAAGYVVYLSDTPPSEHRGYYIALEGPGPAIKAGDLAIIRTRFFEADRGARLTNRVWGAHAEGLPFRNELLDWPDDPEAGNWRLVPHSSDTPVEQPGETYLRVTLEDGQTRVIGSYNHSGLQQDWYQVLQPGQTYRVDVWMRGQATQPVVFELTGFYGRDGQNRIEPVQFSITPEWQKYGATFEVPIVNPGNQAGEMLLRFSGPGIFDIDNFRIYRADTPFLAFLPEDIERLEASGMGILRTHSFVKTHRATYDLGELTNPGGASNTTGGNTLPQLLVQMERLGIDPWLQIEPHFTREEWLGLVEYLAAPFDPTTDDASALPWAAKRFFQGFGPWVDRFDQILFEIGNETWNSLFSPWTFPSMIDAVTGDSYSSGTVYGLYQEYVLSIMRESPYWPELEDDLEAVIGGWSGSGGWWGFDYGLDAAAVSPNTLYMTHAAYNGGWDENAGPTQPDADGLFTVLTHVLETGVQRAERHRRAATLISEARGTPLLTGTYEAGPAMQ